MACLPSATASELRGVSFSRIRSSQFSGKEGCCYVFIQQLRLRHNQKAKQNFSSLWCKRCKRCKRWGENREKTKQVNNLQHTEGI